MSPTLALRLWRVAAVGVTAAILLLLLLPGTRLPSSPLASFDKLAHVGAYLAVGLTWHRSGLAAFWVMAFGLLMGAGTEVAQGVMGWGREADPWDLAANVVGVVLGLGVSVMAPGRERAEESGPDDDRAPGRLGR